MAVKFLYFAQVRKAADCESETIDPLDGAELFATLRELAASHGPDMQAILFDASGTLRSSVILLVNGQPVGRDERKTLSAGDEVSILSAVAGG